MTTAADTRDTLPTLAQYAAKSTNRKPNKAAAQSILRDLYDKHAADLTETERRELGELYRWFMPAKPTKPRTEFDWVAKACAGPKEVRDYLRFIRVTADGDRHGVIEASDGHRLHRAPNRGRLPSGFYLPNGEKVAELGEKQWPDFDRVIPDDRRAGQILGDDMAGEGWDVVETKTKPVRTAYARTLPNGKRYGVDTRYVDQAMARPMAKGDPGPELRVPDDEGGALKIKIGRAVAVVMPIRP